MTSGTRLLANILTLVLIYGGIISVTVFAWFKGRPAERYGAALFAASSFSILAPEMWTGQAVPIIPEVLLDTAVAIAFLVLAIRYNNLWLGAAMIVKGIQLAINGSHLTESEDPYLGAINLYAASLNLITLVILIIFLSATIASVRQRRNSQGGRPVNSPPAAAASVALHSGR